MTDTPCLMGVDPGLTGAIAFFWPEHPERVAMEDMPVVDGEVEPLGLHRLIVSMAPTRAIVEQVASMPRDGGKSAFSFGRAYGVARATVALAIVPTHLVRPADWKRHFKLAGGPEGKEASRALALRMFPASAEHFARKKDHNRAEAALLALYLAQVVITGPGEGLS